MATKTLNQAAHTLLHEELHPFFFFVIHSPPFSCISDNNPDPFKIMLANHALSLDYFPRRLKSHELALFRRHVCVCNPVPNPPRSLTNL